MRERTRTLAAASATLLAAVLVWFNYSALLPLIVEDWSLSGFEAGAVFAAFQAGYVVAILPAGRLADRFSTRGVVATGASGTGIASIGFALFATGFWSGVGFRGVAGVFMAGVYVPGMRLLSEWYPASDRGTALGVYAGAFSLSTGLSFFLSSAVASALDWRVAIGATSLGAVFAGPVLLATTREHPDESTRAREFDLSVLKDRSYRYAVGTYAGHTWELFGARNWIQAFLVAAPAVAATDDPTLTGGVIAGTALSLGGLGNLAGGWASDRLGRIRTITAALLVSTTVSLGLGLVADLPPDSGRDRDRLRTRPRRRQFAHLDGGDGSRTRRTRRRRTRGADADRLLDDGHLAGRLRRRTGFWRLRNRLPDARARWPRGAGIGATARAGIRRADVIRVDRGDRPPRPRWPTPRRCRASAARRCRRAGP